MRSAPFKKVLLLTAGFLSAGVAVVGIFIPLLPTTPLLLVALWCFYRSSRRMHDRIMGHPVLGSYVRDYVEQRAIGRAARRRTLALLWLSLALSAWLARRPFVAILLAVIGTGVTLHILRLRVLDPAAPAPAESRGKPDGRAEEESGA